MSLIYTDFKLNPNSQLDLSNQTWTPFNQTLQFDKSSSSWKMFSLLDLGINSSYTFGIYINAKEYNRTNKQQVSWDNFTGHNHGGKIRANDLHERILITPYKMDSSYVYWNVDFYQPMIENADEIEGFTINRDSYRRIKIAAYDEVGPTTDDKDHYFLDFQFKNLDGEEIPWTLISNDDTLNNVATYDKDGNIDLFTYRSTITGYGHNLAIYNFKQTCKIRTKAESITEAYIKIGTYNDNPGSNHNVYMNINYDEGSSNLNAPRYNTISLSYYLGSVGDDLVYHDLGYYMGLIPGQPKNIDVNLSSLANISIPELFCKTKNADTNHITSIYVMNSDTGEVTNTLDITSKGSSSISDYDAGFKDIKVSQLFNGTPDVGLYEVGQIIKSTDGQAASFITYFTMNIKDMYQVPYSIKETDRYYLNADTKQISTTDKIFQIVGKSTPDYSHFQPEKLKIYQKTYYIKSSAATAPTEIKVDITNHVNIVYEQGYYNVYVKDSFNVFTISGLTQYNAIWPYCTSSLSNNGLYKNEIELIYDGLEDERSVIKFPISLCYRYDWNVDQNTQSKGSLDLNNTYVYGYSQFAPWRIQDYNGDTVRIIYAHDNFHVLKNNPNVSSQYMFNTTIADWNEQHNVEKTTDGKSQIMVYGSSGAYQIRPLIKRSNVDQDDVFDVYITIPGDSYVYKYIQVKIHKSKDNVWFYGYDDLRYSSTAVPSNGKYVNTKRFVINTISDNTKANYFLFYSENKDFSKLDFKFLYDDDSYSGSIKNDLWGNEIIEWRFGSVDDVTIIDGIPYNKVYIWLKDDFHGNNKEESNRTYSGRYSNCFIFDKDNGGRGYFHIVYFDKEDVRLGYLTRYLRDQASLTKISNFQINKENKSVQFTVNSPGSSNYTSISIPDNFGYKLYSDQTYTNVIQDFKQFQITDIIENNKVQTSQALWRSDSTTFIAKLPENSFFGSSYIAPQFSSKTGYVEADVDNDDITGDDIKNMNEDGFVPEEYKKDRTGGDFHFIDKSITVDPTAQTKDVRFYWDGLLTDLTIFSASGFPSVSYVTLPTELTDNGIYTLKVKFDENIGSVKKNYSLTIAKRSDTTIRDSFSAVQNNIILPELSWVQTEYSGIKYNQTTQDIQFKYLGTKTPYEDLQLTTDAGFVILPELPKTKSSDGIYTINVNIGSNLTTDKKIAFIGIAYKDYSAISYKETKLIQDVKKDPILTITPNIYNVNNEVNIISVKLKFDDYENTTPKDGLYVSNNLGLVDYELPAELTGNKEYNLSITVPANNTENDRDFYFTVKTNDAKYSATVNIHQGAAQLTKLYFTPDNISVDATQNTVNVLLFYNGKSSPYNDLIITNSWGENVQLPKTVNPDGFYNITLNIGTNTSYEAKDLTADIQTKDGKLDNSLYIYQRGAILPDTVFYWEQSSYSIEFYENYIEAVLHYNDQLGGIPFDTLSIAPESTYREFSLPTVYNADGIYRIRFNIGPNIDYEIKRYTVVLVEKATGNKQSVLLSIGAKQSPQLFWLPDSLTINHDQESIQVNYYWNNYQGGTPSNYLMMSSNITGFTPYLPDTIAPNNNYTFVINLGENTGLTPRNYTVTLRSADRLYSSVLHIMQYGTGGDADFTYYFEKQNIIAPASGEVPHGYISNKLIGSLTNLTGEYDIISIPYWIKKENIRFDKTGGLLIIDKETPNVFAERTGKIQVLFYSEDGKTYAAEFTVTQEAGEIDSTNISPIWRDCWVNIDADYNYFRLVNKKTNQIYFNGQTIQGELAQLKLNNVISDYLNVWSSFGSSLQNGNNFTTSPVEISVSCSKDGSEFDYTLPDSYKFIWDYSYDKHVPGILFNGNIINYYDPRQKMMISSSNRSNYEMITKVETIFANDSKSTIEEYSLLPGEMHATFVPAYSGSGDGAVKIKVSCTVQGQTEVKEYVPKCTKANYVLHYVNRYGQVCWMLFAGKQIKSDKITSSKFVQAYDNNYRYNFENVVYQNKVEESWQLTTSYLTDKQSENLTDLYSSPIVFLEDLNADNKDNIIAVTVETKSVDYKNYKNQGKFFTHTIKVQNAQNKFILL